MTITLSNDKIFLHRDYAIDGIRWYLTNDSYDSLVFSEECAPFPIELHATVTVPVKRENAQDIKGLRPTYAIIGNKYRFLDDYRDTDYYYYYIDKVTTLSNNGLRIEMTLDVKNTLLSNQYDYVNASKTSYQLQQKYLSSRSFIQRKHVARYNATLSEDDTVNEKIKLYPIIDRIDEGLRPQLRTVSLHPVADTMDDKRYFVAFGESYKNFFFPKAGGGDDVIRYYLPFRAYLFRENKDSPAIMAKSLDIDSVDSPEYTNVAVADVSTIPTGAGNLTKILELPYCPVSKTKEGNVFKFFSGVVKRKDFPYLTDEQSKPYYHLIDGFGRYFSAWTGGAHTGDIKGQDYLHVDTISTESPWIEYENSITGTKDSWELNEARALPLPKFENNDLESVEILPGFNLDYSTTPLSLEMARGTLKETKLYNSTFYQVRFIYDSETFFYMNEYLGAFNHDEVGNPIKVHPVFKVSNSVNSEVMFDFRLVNAQYATDGAFQNIMTITRNLEHTLYSSSFLDYLKGGYNYDRKSMALQSQSSAFNVAMGIGQGAINTAISSIVNPVAGASSAIGTGINAVSSIVNHFNAQESRENSFQAKMASAMGGSATVASSSDVDMLNYYCPKLLVGTYRVVTNRQSLEDLFYYFGYARNTTGKPTAYNRYWFDYIQADVIYDELPNWVSKEMEDELTSSYRNGIIFFHCHSVYSFDFTKENIENALVNRFII